MIHTVFLTGGTGLVGADVLRRLLAMRPDMHIIALVRGSDPIAAEARLRTAVELMEGRAFPEQQWQRVRILCGDMTQPSCGLSDSELDEFCSSVTHFVHAASDVRFDLPLEEARRVNVGGTACVLDLALAARRKGALERFTYISTAYVCGNTGGGISEEAETGVPAFSNSYEQSKYESEQLVRAAMAELPCTILRPSIIVGDAETGRANAFKALYAPLRLLVNNMVHCLPGAADIPMDVVPVDYVSKAICHLLFDDGASIGRTLHLTAGRTCSCTAGEIVRRALVAGRNGVGTAAATISFIPPERIDPAMACSAGERALMMALSQFSPYLAISRSFDDTQARSLLRDSGIALRPFGAYLSTILRFAIESGWGKRFALAA